MAVVNHRVVETIMMWAAYCAGLWGLKTEAFYITFEVANKFLPSKWLFILMQVDKSTMMKVHAFSMALEFVKWPLHCPRYFCKWSDPQRWMIRLSVGLVLTSFYMALLLIWSDLQGLSRAAWVVMNAYVETGVYAFQKEKKEYRGFEVRLIFFGLSE